MSIGPGRRRLEVVVIIWFVLLWRPGYGKSSIFTKRENGECQYKCTILQRREGKTSMGPRSGKKIPYPQIGLDDSSHAWFMVESRFHSPSRLDSSYLSPEPIGRVGQHHKRDFLPRTDSILRRRPRS